MKELEGSHSSLPDDIALKIASSLQVTDLCALGCCSRFWRQLCGSDHIWESLVRKRWPLLDFLKEESSSAFHSQNPEVKRNSKEWRRFYILQHNERAVKARIVVRFVAECSVSNSLEVGDYLKAIQDLSSMKLGFKDVKMFLFKPNLNVLVNLIGLHYCIRLLKVPTKHVFDALQSCKISERQVCVKWWKLGRWFYGFRMRDESHSRLVSLMDLGVAEEQEVLGVLHRGAIHEVLRVQISIGNSIFSPTPASC